MKTIKDHVGECWATADEYIEILDKALTKLCGPNKIKKYVGEPNLHPEGIDMTWNIQENYKDHILVTLPENGYLWFEILEGKGFVYQYGKFEQGDYNMIDYIYVDLQNKETGYRDMIVEACCKRALLVLYDGYRPIESRDITEREITRWYMKRNVMNESVRRLKREFQARKKLQEGENTGGYVVWVQYQKWNMDYVEDYRNRFLAIGAETIEHDTPNRLYLDTKPIPIIVPSVDRATVFKTYEAAEKRIPMAEDFEDVVQAEVMTVEEASTLPDKMTFDARDWRWKKTKE